jgi:glucose dehydrogenase
MFATIALFAAALSPETASRLKIAWRYDIKAVPPNARAARIAAFEATPVLAGDLLYVITPFNQVIALDPGTGAERWVFDPKVAGNRSYSEASARGVAVHGGLVYFGTLDARVIALNARDGRKVWEARIGPDGNDGNYQLTSAPVGLRLDRDRRFVHRRQRTRRDGTRYGIGVRRQDRKT